MNEVDIVIGVFISTGAGYLLGKHFERKKAQQAFKDFRAYTYQATMATTNGIMDVVRARLPDADVEVLMQEIVDSCAKYGAEVVAYNPATNHIIKGESSDDKAK